MRARPTSAMIWLSTVWVDRGLDVEALRRARASPSSIAPRITPSSTSVRLARCDPGLFEERHAVGDRLDAGEGAAPGGEGLQHEEDADRLERVGGDQGARRAGGACGAERVDEADDDDRRAARR